MQLFITILHIVLAITMILIILLQPGKEGGAALAGGGRVRGLPSTRRPRERLRPPGVDVTCDQKQATCSRHTAKKGT